MTDIFSLGATATLAYFLSEETRYRLCLVLSLVLISLCLLGGLSRIAYALEDVAALGYEIRNLRAYLRPIHTGPTVPRPANTVVPPVTPDSPATSPAEDVTVPTPPSK